MIVSYLLIALSLGLVGVVATTQTRLAPFVMAAALIASISAVEMAKGWATYFDPPRQGIVYGAWLGHYMVISGTEPGSALRLYSKAYDPGVEGALKQAGGPMMYDLDRKKPEGGGSPGDDPHGGGPITGEDLTSLEENYGGK